MAGTILERQLTVARTGRVRFDIGCQSDDAEIRRLLRDNPMPGRISLSLEREPNCFADADLPGETERTVVARDGGRLVCVGCCTIRQHYVNGAPRRVGYLGGLRLDARYAGRFDILRRGYEFFRELQAEAPADFYFTSIASDNERARKLLEYGLPGMPLYDFIGNFVTVLFPVHGKTRSKAALDSRPIDQRLQTFGPAKELVSCLNESNRAYQFAPCWSPDELIALSSLGLQAADFYAVRNGQRLAACAALWDQRNFKQTVIRGYAPWVGFARPIFNSFARITNRPQLPVVGETLAKGYISHLAGGTEETGSLIALLTELRSVAARRGIALLTLGFDAKDPRLALVRKTFRCREYQSRLYVVRWPGIGGAAGELDDRCLGPEVALL